MVEQFLCGLQNVEYEAKHSMLKERDNVDVEVQK